VRSFAAGDASGCNGRPARIIRLTLRTVAVLGRAVVLPPRFTISAALASTRARAGRSPWFLSFRPVNAPSALASGECR
jgi:hypothetical protein